MTLQCGSACQEAKTAEACCEACMVWAAANGTCKSWFFRGSDKQCMLKGCASFAECLGQVTSTEVRCHGVHLHCRGAVDCNTIA